MKPVDFEVVIPAMNAEDTVEYAIASAFDSGAKVVTVVDDGSSDRTAEVALRAGAEVLTQPNSGPTAARIQGLRRVRAGLLCFLDADDRLCPDGVREACDLLHEDERAVGVVGRYRYAVDGRTRSIAARGYSDLTVRGLVGQGHGPAPPSAIVYRTTAVRAAVSESYSGPWSGAKYADDYELLIRTACIGIVHATSRVTCVYAFGSGRSFAERHNELRDRRSVQQHYSELFAFPVPPWSTRRDRATVLVAQARLAHLRGSFLQFGRYVLFAVALDPMLVLRALNRRRTLGRRRVN